MHTCIYMLHIRSSCCCACDLSASTRLNDRRRIRGRGGFLLRNGMKFCLIALNDAEYLVVVLGFLFLLQILSTVCARLCIVSITRLQSYF